MIHDNEHDFQTIFNPYPANTESDKSLPPV